MMLQAPSTQEESTTTTRGILVSSFWQLVVDANCCFIYVSVGCQGRQCDGGVFDHSLLNKMLQDSTLNFSTKSCLPGKISPVPYVLLVDDDFALREHINKPFPGVHQKGSKGRIYNDHCRAQKVVENPLGIISVVFQHLRNPYCLSLTMLNEMCWHHILQQGYLILKIHRQISWYPVNGGSMGFPLEKC